MKKANRNGNSSEDKCPPDKRHKQTQYLDVQDFGPAFGETPQTRGEEGLKPPADEPGKQNNGCDNEERRRVGAYPRCGHEFSLTTEDAEDTEKIRGPHATRCLQLAVFGSALDGRGNLALSSSAKTQPFPSPVIFHSAFCILRFGKLNLSPSSSTLSALSALI
ncbi:MAG: hypothetical protein ACKOEI_10965, partial [Chthoniobacterales bacterium]